MDTVTSVCLWPSFVRSGDGGRRPTYLTRILRCSKEACFHFTCGKEVDASSISRNSGKRTAGDLPLRSGTAIQ